MSSNRVVIESACDLHSRRWCTAHRAGDTAQTSHALSGELNSLYPFMPSFTCFLVILAADQSNARSILLYQTNLDKVKQLSSHSAMGVSGPNCDSVNFTEYVTITEQNTCSSRSLYQVQLCSNIPLSCFTDTLTRISNCTNSPTTVPNYRHTPKPILPAGN
jgi:hypothetical protein